jgi:hypothetical protein
MNFIVQHRILSRFYYILSIFRAFSFLQKARCGAEWQVFRNESSWHVDNDWTKQSMIVTLLTDSNIQIQIGSRLQSVWIDDIAFVITH